MIKPKKARRKLDDQNRQREMRRKRSSERKDQRTPEKEARPTDGSNRGRTNEKKRQKSIRPRTSEIGEGGRTTILDESPTTPGGEDKGKNKRRNKKKKGSRASSPTWDDSGSLSDHHPTGAEPVGKGRRFESGHREHTRTGTKSGARASELGSSPSKRGGGEARRSRASSTAFSSSGSTPSYSPCSGTDQGGGWRERGTGKPV